MAMAISPTLKNRIESLDVLRGAAILGILLANIFAFAWPQLGEMMGAGIPIPGMNDWVEGLRVALVTGKFRGLFCLLFGAGMYLQFTKLEARGGWPGTYLKRNLILMGIGLIHALLIWYGDILFMYSMIAFGAMWFTRASDKTLLITGSAMIGACFLCGAGIVGAMAALGSDMGAGGSGGMDFGLNSQRELAVFGAGTYLEQLQMRGMTFVFMLFNLPMIGLELGGLMLNGMYLMRSGVLAKPSANPTLTRNLMIVGGVGLLLNLVLGASIGMTGNHDVELLAEFGLNAPLCIGYAIFGAVMVERNPGGLFSRLFAPVGKVALTCYLLTSVICTTAFYSWGGGLFGKLNYFGMIGFTFGVWIVLIGVAHLITRRYSMGPVEFVWRRMTLGDFGSRQVQPEAGPATLGLPPRME